MSNYKREDVVITITGPVGLGSHIITGYAPGDFLDVTPDGEGWTEIVGSHGLATRCYISAPGAAMVLRLHGASKSNKFLQSCWSVDRSTGSDPFAIMVKDMRSDLDLIVSDFAYIKQVPQYMAGEDIKQKEWNIRLLKAKILHGGQETGLI